MGTSLVALTDLYSQHHNPAPSPIRKDVIFITNRANLIMSASPSSADTECGHSSAEHDKRVDVRRNWKEKPGMPDDWQGRSAWEE
jgi:hypothetical protein